MVEATDPRQSGLEDIAIGSGAGDERGFGARSAWGIARSRHVGRMVLAGLRHALRHLEHGTIRLTLPCGACEVFGRQGQGVTADLTLRNYRLFWQGLGRGALGFAECYINGDVETENIADLCRFFVGNKPALVRGGNGRFRARARDRRLHAARRNTRAGSRRNIAEHYDLGNEFYRLWLDPGMTYSSAMFSSGNEPLEVAQQRKYRQILDRLALAPGSDILEIGCGWGAFAEMAASDGHSVVGLTLSREQLAYAQTRVAQAGLAGRCDLRLQDYRDVDGQFDGIASIEMVEAVGEENWPIYFSRLRDCLKPGGHAVLQAITIAEEYYPVYRRQPDFIQRYIFPGGMLPTKSAMAEQARAAGLEVLDRTCFGQSYARTLWQWRSSFNANWPEIRQLGFDQRFERMWDYYLTYCAVGFEMETIDVGLYEFRRPE